MNNFGAFYKTRLPLSVMLLAIIALSSCSPSLGQAERAPIVHTAEVTRLVTRDVTLEVTRLIEVPVTVTPSATSQFTLTPSLTPTITSTPTITPTPELPQLTILQYTDCLYGPGELYLYKTSYPAGSRVEVVGRSQDALWINVQEIHGWNACWIPASQVRLDHGSVSDLPFVYTTLPLTRYDYSPPMATALRDGDEVTVSWEAIWMSRYELRGYLIEAWVCQTGQHIFLPIHVFPTYEENVTTLSITIRDEAGCVEPSSARIATSSKRGYTLFEKIFWPPR
jgi:hypothetical protein